MARSNGVALLFAALVIAAPCAHAAPRTVVDRRGAVLRTLPPHGPRARFAGHGGLADLAERTTPGARVPPDSLPPARTRESRRDGWIIDREGHVLPDPSRQTREPVTPDPASSLASSATIDSFTTYDEGFHYIGSPWIDLVGSASTYYLSNGTTWNTGAGSYYILTSPLKAIHANGDSIRFTLWPTPSNGIIYLQTDYDAGNHSSHGALAVLDTMVIETVTGSRTATMRGTAIVINNDPADYTDERFHFFSAMVGSVVPFRLTYTLFADYWDAQIFDRSFSYYSEGLVDFAHPVSVPHPVQLSIFGPSLMPGGASAPYTAVARYDVGVRRDVTRDAGWSVSPGTVATISPEGVLAVGALPSPAESVTVSATFTDQGLTVSADKLVRLRNDLDPEKPDAWPMYQADHRHSGYVPVTLDPRSFHPLWQVPVGPGYPLAPVAAVDGRVFCTVIAFYADFPTVYGLDAATGAVLWSDDFGETFSVNPPSAGYGNVYVQSVNGDGATWLWALDQATGDPVFRTPHESQAESYFAPTLYDNKVYANGGYYGGMYAFDALAGRQQWYVPLPQYDQWTPAVDADHAYAYVGEEAPALYVTNRLTGALEYTIPDPNFTFQGWSMNVAPVLGDHDDVLATQYGRLISFDLASRTIGWELSDHYAGQPAVAHGQVFVVNRDTLVVLDEQTHEQLWSWRPPNGAFDRGAPLVTERHVFVSANDSVYAVDLATHRPVWAYAAWGTLALGNQSLYVVSPWGTLAAIGVSGGNHLPDLAHAHLDRDELWPPNGQLVATRVTGITDADGDPVKVRITGVNVTDVWPEPLRFECGDVRVDADGTVWLKAEREAAGSGRTYTVRFTAEDGHGPEVAGEVTACVPHDRGHACTVEGDVRDALRHCAEIAPVTPAAGEVFAVTGAPDQKARSVAFRLDAPAHVTIALFDLAGRRVRTMVDELHAAGDDQRTWDVGGLANGVYFVRMNAGAMVRTKTVIVRR